jgi:hypothetical protein
LKLVDAQTLTLNKEPKPDFGKKVWSDSNFLPHLEPTPQLGSGSTYMSNWPSPFHTWPCSLSVLILSILEPGPSSS